MRTCNLHSWPLLLVGCAALLLGCPSPETDEICATGEPSPGDWSQDCGVDFCANTTLQIEMKTFEDSPLPCETAGGVDCQGQTGGADFTYDYRGGTNFLMTMSAAGDPAWDEASFRAAFMSMDLDLQIEPTLESDGAIYRYPHTVSDVNDFETFGLTDDHFEATLELIVDTVEADMSLLDDECAAAGIECSCAFQDFELPTTLVFDLYLEPF